MPFSAGDKLGPYEILEPIGTGAMGTQLERHRQIRPVRIAHHHERGAAHLVDHAALAGAPGIARRLRGSFRLQRLRIGLLHVIVDFLDLADHALVLCFRFEPSRAALVDVQELAAVNI